MNGLRRVVKEWMERMITAYMTKGGCSSDQNMDCPNCKRPRAVSFFHGRGWECVYRDCGFTFPEMCQPPTPEEFEEYLKAKELRGRIEDFLSQ